MSEENSKDILPSLIIDLYNKNLILGVIQFGSSIFKNNPKDIDIAVILKSGSLEKFLSEIENSEPISSNYDVSLILEEELSLKENFNFGGHGSYIIESFRNGNTLIGENPFKLFPKIDQNKIHADIVERMKEYVYILRKSYFDISFLDKLISRYYKFIKLSLLVLSKEKEYKYPEIMLLADDIVLSNISKLGYILGADKRLNMEILWKEIRKQYL